MTGRAITQHEGTLERFAGDGLVVVFNDPVVVPNPEERAVRISGADRRGRHRATSPVGELELKGFRRPVMTHRILALRH